MREYTVTEASIIIAGSFLVSAVLGAIRQVLLNARFGSGDDISAYYAAARLPDTLFALIAGGAIWTAMIPVLTESRSRGEAESRRLADIVLTTVLLVAIAIVIVGEISTPLFVRHLLVPGFD